jgi:uncharacterized membrane protein YcaP (DUF421 family)
MSQMPFDGWAVLGRTVLVGALAYAALVIILRLSGRRTLSKMKAVVLETDGSFSVISSGGSGSPSFEGLQLPHQSGPAG